MNDPESDGNPTGVHFESGDFVRITAGPFAGMTAVVYREIADHLVVTLTSTGARHAIRLDDVVRELRGNESCDRA